MALSDFLDGELLYALGSRLARQQGRDLDTRVVVQKRILVRSAQRVPEPDPLPGISLDTQPNPIHFWKLTGSG